LSISFSQKGVIQPIIRHLDGASSQLTKTLERLSSGARINRASDDAAGLSVVSSLEVKRRIFNRGVQNLSDGLSALTIADQAVSQLGEIVTRQRELAEQAANGTFSEVQRKALNQEGQALRAEYQRIISTTSFNGINLLNGSSTSFTLQAGIGENSTLDAGILRSSQVDASFIQEMGFALPEFYEVYNDSEVVFAMLPDELTVVAFIFSLPDVVGAEVVLSANTYRYNGEELELVSSTTLGTNALTDIEGQAGDLDFTFEMDTPSIFRVSITVNNNPITDYVVEVGNEGQFLDISQQSFTRSDSYLTNSIDFDLTGNGTLDSITSSGPGNDGFSVTFNGQNELIENINQASFSLLTRSLALSALDSLAGQSEKIADVRSRIGALQSRISTASNVLQVASEQFSAAESRIKDVDIASETANATRYSIIQDSAAAVLAQANTTPTIILQLLE